MAETTLIKLSSYIPALLISGSDIFIGTTTPGNTSAPQGTLFLNTAGSGTTDRLWVNTDGSTTWAYFTSSA